MDLLLALNLVHALGAIAWLAGGAVLALILLFAGGRPDAALRAVPEAALIGSRVLRPTGAVTLATGILLATQAGLAFVPWVILASALVAGSLLAHPLLLAPALAEAEATGAPAAIRRALDRARLDLLPQVAVLALMVLRPGWFEAAILAGLAACLLLALALLRSLGEASQSA